jgi:3-oxoacyl-[acyl-carrier protein] reductase
LRGLGAAITEALARESAGVIIDYRRSEAQARALACYAAMRIDELRANALRHERSSVSPHHA